MTMSAAVEAPALLLCSPVDGETVAYLQTSVLIGRHPECDMQFPYPDISRRHARLYQEEGKWYVYDMGSLNGTYINGQALENGAHAMLINNDVLKVSAHLSFIVKFEE